MLLRSAIAFGMCMLAFAAHGSENWWAPNEDRVFPAELSYPNASGVITTLNAAGPTRTQDHPFFKAIGANGRACVTCHQPADAMSLSAATARERWQATQGKDVLFAAIDGSNCPSLPQEQESSHSLLLQRGLIRIARPWPPRALDGSIIKPQFDIEVVRDPTGCNRDAKYGLKSAQPQISVYRRVRPATNVKYLTAVGFNFDPKNGLPLPTDSETGQLVSGNILADARAPTLFAQARDAVHSHLQGTPNDADIKRIVEFLQGLYTAQSRDAVAGNLNEEGAQGGPAQLQKARAGDLQGGIEPIWMEFFAWKKSAAVAQAQRAQRESIARGAELFSKRMFLVDDSTGINNMGFGNPVRNACAFCHNMQRTGLDVAPGQVDIGTVNYPHANPSPELPMFKLTCHRDAPAHPYFGRVVFTQDPGYALTTGKCVDIGKITAQSMRGLAARAPYFSNGSAQTLRELVDYYDRRYHIDLSEQEKQDLVNLMSVL